MRCLNCFCILFFGVLVQLLHRSGAFSVPSESSNPGKTPCSISFEALNGQKILVVGGSGRVGGSVVAQLVKRRSKVTVGGTSLDNFVEAQNRWQQLFPEHTNALANIPFQAVDREVAGSFDLKDFDLVVHTAGPFQGKVSAPNGVLEACVAAGVPYMDVCDDYCTASAAKTKYSKKANVPCVLSTGTWPGVSSLMAKQLLARTLEQHPKLTPADITVEFSFFTAGSGGAGVTLLVATFLILAEQALKVVNGRRTTVPPLQNFESTDFGGVVGSKEVAPLNLLETASIHDTLGVGSTSSKFGTAPWYWNTLLGVFGANVPKSMLENEPLMRQLSAFSMPIVRLVDMLAGATNAIRVDLSTKGQVEDDPKVKATAIYAHENLEPCVGESIVAFAAAVLSGSVPAGVWFPEEAITAGADARAVLHMASVGTHTTTVDGNLGLTVDDVFGPKERKENIALAESRASTVSSSH